MCFGCLQLNCWLSALYIVVGIVVILLPVLLWKIPGVWHRDRCCEWAEISKSLFSDELRFASYYADHMVLQKQPAGAVLWGYGKSNATITMGLYKESNLVVKKMTQIEGHSRIWKIVLNPMSQGGPYQIKVLQSFKGNNANMTLNDIYFGDVWLCSGQSNMEMPLSKIFNGSKELDDTSKFPFVRVFAASNVEAEQERQDLVSVGLQWSVPTAANRDSEFSRFSAVCWLFGRYLFETLKYPIGLVQSTWDGTTIETWSSKRVLQKCGLAEMTFRKILNIPAPYKKSVIWNAMIHPLLNMTLRGAIWYQGEANTYINTEVYNCTFPALIEDWRKSFHRGSDGQTERFFPFGFVQLSTNNETRTAKAFPCIRWHQTAGSGYVPNTKMPNTFMAVAIDLGDFNSPFRRVHPRDKQTVAYRLHLGARAVAYGEKNLTFQGPFPQRVHVSMAEKRIKVKFGQKILLHHLDKKIFEVYCSEANGVFMWNPAPMESSQTFTVTLRYPACPDSVAGLRYAWTEWPCKYKQCPIYNLQMLPAAPFIIFSENNPEWTVF